MRGARYTALPAVSEDSGRNHCRWRWTAVFVSPRCQRCSPFLLSCSSSKKGDCPLMTTSALICFRLRHPAYDDIPVTVRMLASHTSGLRDGKVYSIPPFVSAEAFFSADSHTGKRDSILRRRKRYRDSILPTATSITASWELSLKP